MAYHRKAVQTLADAIRTENLGAGELKLTRRSSSNQAINTLISQHLKRSIDRVHCFLSSFHILPLLPYITITFNSPVNATRLDIFSQRMVRQWHELPKESGVTVLEGIQEPRRCSTWTGLWAEAQLKENT